MSSLHFPIIVGENQSERVVIIHLVSDEESYTDNRVVITDPKAAKYAVFSIHQDVQLIDEDGQLTPVSFFPEQNNIPSVEVTTTAGNLHHRFSDDKHEYRVDTAKFDGIIHFKYVERNTDPNGQLHILEYNGQLHIVRPSNTEPVIRINTDLGSDATQVNCYNTKGVTNVKWTRLVEGFKNAYSSSTTNPREYDKLTEPRNRKPLFLQMEKDQPVFYKTGNITFKIGGIIDKDIDDPNTFINYLNVSSAGKNEPSNQTHKTKTSDKEIDFKNKSINIKMLYAHYNEPSVSNSVANIYFKIDGNTINQHIADQEALLQVLYRIYKQIIKIALQNVSTNNCQYYSVLLLVPNIYTQGNIDNLLYEVNKMNGELRLPDDRPIAIDFRVISESDSAFVGIKAVKKEGAITTILQDFTSSVTDSRQKDVFLIIDSGKGTTDYSIIRYNINNSGDSNNSMLSVKRGGIVGAGGAIDYVFARIFARQVFRNFSTAISIEESLFVDRFMEMITLLNPVDQDVIMLIVETMKKSYSDENHNITIAKTFTCFQSDEAKKIINNLGSQETIEYGLITENVDGWNKVSEWHWDNQRISVDQKDIEEVEWVCDAIAETMDKIIFEPIEVQTLIKQIDYVIFNGRSFNFTPLKKAFLKYIEKRRGVYSVNMSRVKKLLYPTIYEKIGKKRQAEGSAKINWDDQKNLKEAILEGFDMKQISVHFVKHDLGVNCNSDLCNMIGLSTANDDAFEKAQFWQGFTDVLHPNHKVFYIGYGHGNLSFAPAINQLEGAPQMTTFRAKLIDMTLFPVNYLPIDFNQVAAPVHHGGNTNATAAAPTVVSPTTANTNPNDTNTPDSIPDIDIDLTEL